MHRCWPAASSLSRRPRAPSTSALAPFRAPGPAARRIAVLLPLTGQNAALGPGPAARGAACARHRGPATGRAGHGRHPVRRHSRRPGRGRQWRRRHRRAADRGRDSRRRRGRQRASRSWPSPRTATRAGPASGRWASRRSNRSARLVQALSRSGRRQIAAVLPGNVFGDALADGLTTRRRAAGRPAAHDPALPDGRGRRAGRGAAGRVRLRPTRRRHCAAPAPDPLAAPGPGRGHTPRARRRRSSALLLAETGPALQAAAASLAKIRRPRRPPCRSSAQPPGRGTPANLGGLAGAWYAAPDPATRGAFETIYNARYGSPPPGVASIAYDAAQLARVAAAQPGRPDPTRRFPRRGRADGPAPRRPGGARIGRVRRGPGRRRRWSSPSPPASPAAARPGRAQARRHAHHSPSSRPSPLLTLAGAGRCSGSSRRCRPWPPPGWTCSPPPPRPAVGARAADAWCGRAPRRRWAARRPVHQWRTSAGRCGPFRSARDALAGQVRTEEAIVETLPDPLIVLGPDRAMLRANAAAHAAFGAEMSAVLRHPVPAQRHRPRDRGRPAAGRRPVPARPGRARGARHGVPPRRRAGGRRAVRPHAGAGAGADAGRFRGQRQPRTAHAARQPDRLHRHAARPGRRRPAGPGPLPRHHGRAGAAA